MGARSSREVTPFCRLGVRTSAAEIGVPCVRAIASSGPPLYGPRAPRGQKLQTTTLIHGTYLWLGGVRQVKWQDRTHFLAICAQRMRRILIDFAQSRGYQKREGGASHVNFHEAPLQPAQPDFARLALDQALNQLPLVEACKSKVGDLRFFGVLRRKWNVMKVQPMRSCATANAKVGLLREFSRGTPDGA